MHATRIEGVHIMEGRSKRKLVAVTHMLCWSFELILLHNFSIGFPSSCFWLQMEEKQRVKETYACMHATRIEGVYIMEGRSKRKLVAVTHMLCWSFELILLHNFNIGFPSSCFWLQMEEKQRVKETYPCMHATRIEGVHIMEGRSKRKLVAVTHMLCWSFELILLHNFSIGFPSSCFWLQMEEKQTVKETYECMYAT